MFLNGLFNFASMTPHRSAPGSPSKASELDFIILKKRKTGGRAGGRAGGQTDGRTDGRMAVPFMNVTGTAPPFDIIAGKPLVSLKSP